MVAMWIWLIMSQPILYYPVEVETRHAHNYFDAGEFQKGKNLSQKRQRYFLRGSYRD